MRLEFNMNLRNRIQFHAAVFWPATESWFCLFAMRELNTYSAL